MSVREIRGWTPATSLPHSPAYVRGVINLRGAVLPVIDLASRLGLPTGELTDRNVIIVVNIDGRTVGLLVDAVSDILSIPEDELAPPPELAADAAQTFISALTIVDGPDDPRPRPGLGDAGAGFGRVNAPVASDARGRVAAVVLDRATFARVVAASPRSRPG